MSAAREMEWRPCVGFPAYEVSECGDVRGSGLRRPNRRGIRLRGFINAYGYLSYALMRESGRPAYISAHRLVAEAFLGPPPTPLHEAAHNNGSRVSCAARDLRWATRKENDNDKEVHGTTNKGECNGCAKITEDDVRYIRTAVRFKSHHVLAKEYGLHRHTIYKIVTGRLWSHIPVAGAAL